MTIDRFAFDLNKSRSLDRTTDQLAISWLVATTVGRENRDAATTRPFRRRRIIYVMSSAAAAGRQVLIICWRYGSCPSKCGAGEPHCDRRQRT